MFNDISFTGYIEQLSSNSPTPGGGNVSATCGILASSLGEMVCNLTIGKKKYLEVEAEITKLKEILSSKKDIFEKLAEEDNLAFDKVMEAFKLPKATDEEKEFRINQIEIATLKAMAVPLSVMRNCYDLLEPLKIISSKGNKNSVSDTGVAVLLAQSGAKGAYLNVLINGSSLKHLNSSIEMIKEADLLISQIDEFGNNIFNYIKEGIVNAN